MQIELSKMQTRLDDKVYYRLVADELAVEMNEFIGKPFRMKYDGKTQCQHCRKMKRLFAQGFCYDCFLKSPDASQCIINPEFCEGHLGKGRDVEWEQKHHVQPHFVYLAASAAVKVGVTRCTQVPTRWIDQGASFAIKFAEVPYRRLAGEIEVALKDCFTDKTSWQAMLKNEVGDFDLVDEKWRLEEMLPSDLTQYMCEDDEIIGIIYPVLEYPKKITSVTLDKTPLVEGTLIGIKGQYLMFDDGRVLNVRKHDGYHVEIG
jgi:hypothetical protein